MPSTNSLPTISICIPAYSRPNEYSTLLKSLSQLTHMPHEVLVCEDGSVERNELRSMTLAYQEVFAQRGCLLRFHENTQNLGYDANLRQLLGLANSEYVFFIGNDDYVLPDAISTVQQYLLQHPVLAASRTFLRFKDDPLQPLGTSRVFHENKILDKQNSSAGTMLRIGGYFGGLIFNRKWALTKTTIRYDGSLFYQIYLLLHAFADGDVGYMNTATVAARADNAPLFGSSPSENEHFTPGKYTAKARGKMWKSILQIAQDCESQTQQPMIESIRHELTTRMSFHVFEMFAGRSQVEINALRDELKHLGLYNHYIPKLLYYINTILGRHAMIFYANMRKLLQR